jgi:hypothetical protein
MKILDEKKNVHEKIQQHFAIGTMAIQLFMPQELFHHCTCPIMRAFTIS